MAVNTVTAAFIPFEAMPITANGSARFYCSWIDSSGNYFEVSTNNLAGYQPSRAFRYGNFVSVEFNKPTIGPSGFSAPVGNNVTGFYQSTADGVCYTIRTATYKTSSDAYIFHFTLDQGEPGSWPKQG